MKVIKKKYAINVKGATLEEQLAFCIEQSFAQVLPGKHIQTEAKMLIDTIQSGKLIKGAAATAMFETTKGYIRELFRPWRVLKACDISPVGAFKTSSLNALREVIDE